MVEHLPYTRGCFVCGVDNPQGLHLRFRADEGEVHADFAPREGHAGYPGLLHGGALSAALDEAMFWAASHGVGRMHVSAELTVRFRRKVLVTQSYRIVARLVQARSAMCRTEAELLDVEGEVCATATGKYLPLPREDLPLVLQDFYPDEDTVSPECYLG